jgi:regulator of RNase E activity RraA
LKELQQLDTAAICDADKIMLSRNEESEDPGYQGIKVMHQQLRPINSGKSSTATHVMVGYARTIQCTRRNDFLAVFRGLMEAEKGEILIVDTCGSDQAVAGELFSLQAIQKGVAGIVVDGPVRDTTFVKEFSTETFRCYAASVTPYSGTTQSPGSMQVQVNCGAVPVNPGDIVVGDNDGILVADADTLESLLPEAKAIYSAEAKIKAKLLAGDNILSMTNYEEHIKARLAGDVSNLAFEV